MAEPTTIHVVVAFTKTGDEIAAEPPLQMPTAGQAMQRAKFLVTTHAGAIAWSRTLDPDTGDYTDPQILVRLGTIPDWFDETGDAGG